MVMIYAQIQDNTVVNRIILDNPSLEPIFKQGFQDLIRIDDLTPQPDIGWIWEGDKSFRQPDPNQQG